MSCASVFEFGSPNDGVLVTEEAVPFLAYHTTSYEVVSLPRPSRLQSFGETTYEVLKSLVYESGRRHVMSAILF